MNAIAVIYVNQHLDASGPSPSEPIGLAGSPSGASARASPPPPPASGSSAPTADPVIPSSRTIPYGG